MRGCDGDVVLGARVFHPTAPVRVASARGFAVDPRRRGSVPCSPAESLLAGHPAYPVMLAVCVLVGLLLLATGLRPVAGRPAPPPGGDGGRAAASRRCSRLVVLGVTGLPRARHGGPRRRGRDGRHPGRAGERVTDPDHADPHRAPPPTAGLVFQPGAKVDPRAYVPLLQQVSAAGYLVVIVKQPVDIGFLAIGEPADVVAAPSGGHPLGGRRPQPRGGRRGRVCRPARRRSARAAVLGVLPAHVARRPRRPRRRLRLGHRRRPLHPRGHRGEPGEAARRRRVFTAVPGGVHAYFGDYGPQAGDGTATIDRAAAQQQIVAATTAFLLLVASS